MLSVDDGSKVISNLFIRKPDLFWNMLLYTAAPIAIANYFFNTGMFMIDNSGIGTLITQLNIVYGYFISVVRYDEEINIFSLLGSIILISSLYIVLVHKWSVFIIFIISFSSINNYLYYYFKTINIKMENRFYSFPIESYVLYHYKSYYNLSSLFSSHLHLRYDYLSWWTCFISYFYLIFISIVTFLSSCFIWFICSFILRLDLAEMCILLLIFRLFIHELKWNVWLLLRP